MAPVNLSVDNKSSSTVDLTIKRQRGRTEYILIW